MFMNFYMRPVAALLWFCVAVTLGSHSFAQPTDKVHFSTKGTFSEVFQDVTDAIVNRGFVIDFTGHVDKMLERTSGVAGSVTKSGEKSPYLHAKYVQFCSAKLTHESVSANPYNLAICPYVVFAFESRAKPGTIVVGYRKPQAGPSKLSRAAFAKITKLLADIASEATSN